MNYSMNLNDSKKKCLFCVTNINLVIEICPYSTHRTGTARPLAVHLADKMLKEAPNNCFAWVVCFASVWIRDENAVGLYINEVHLLNWNISHSFVATLKGVFFLNVPSLKA